MTIFDHFSPFLPWKCLFFTPFSHFCLENAHFYAPTVDFWPFLTTLAIFTAKMPIFDRIVSCLPTKWLVLTICHHFYLENAYFWPYCVLFTYKMTIFDHFSPLLPWKCLFFTTFSHVCLENAHFCVQTVDFWPLLTHF